MANIRLYIENIVLESGAVVCPSEDQAHYLMRVMRKSEGEEILVFNGKDGEWRCVITDAGKKKCLLLVKDQTRKQKNEPDVWLCFAPVKNAPINNLTEKVTELGASRLIPIITERTIVSRVNIDRLKANGIEAAEQSRRLTIPEVCEPEKLMKMLDKWDEERILILCDESGFGQPAINVLSVMKKGKIAILIGPEGGFSKAELEILHSKPYIKSISLGPRILRADTAAITAMAVCQSIIGDWDDKPCF